MSYHKLKRIVKDYVPVIEERSLRILPTHYFRGGDGSKPIIKIDTTDMKEKLFPILAHEFGHYLSFRRGWTSKFLRAIKAANSEGFESINSEGKKLIYKEEKTAWKKGEKFVKQEGFEVDPYFVYFKHKCLNSYFDTMSLSNKILKLKKIDWDIFFGDSTSEWALMAFAARQLSFKEFEVNCSLSKERVLIIRSLKAKGYAKSIRLAQRALNLRGFEHWKELKETR